jgi:hypothetical protein
MHAQAILPRINPYMTNLQGSKTLHIRSELASSVMESNSDEGTLGQQLHWLTLHATCSNIGDFEKGDSLKP